MITATLLTYLTWVQIIHPGPGITEDLIFYNCPRRGQITHYDAAWPNHHQCYDFIYEVEVSCPDHNLILFLCDYQVRADR